MTPEWLLVTRLEKGAYVTQPETLFTSAQKIILVALAMCIKYNKIILEKKNPKIITNTTRLCERHLGLKYSLGLPPRTKQ